MRFVVISILISMSSFAEIGKITKLIGNDAYLSRDGQKIKLTAEMLLEKGDAISSQGSVVMMHLYPSSQMTLSRQTDVKLSESVIDETADADKSTSVIDFVKGLIRLQVSKDKNEEVDQKVLADGVAFAVRGTEYEVSLAGEDYDLDVIEGEVEVSSPYVNTFVPEIVKKNEGFRFNKKMRQFQRRKFAQKFKNHPGFIQREELHKQWKQKRAERKQMRLGKKVEKKARRKALRENKRMDRKNKN